MDEELVRELYQSLVLDHSRQPRNFGVLECACHARGKNPSCGDQLELFVKMNEETVEDVKFNGEGCALSVSSASLMTQLIKGKNINEVKQALQDFIDFIIEDDLPLAEKYEPLHIFGNVHNFPSRVKCVLLPWRTLEHIFDKQSDSVVSTEHGGEHS